MGGRGKHLGSKLDKLTPMPIQLNNYGDDIENYSGSSNKLSHITNVMVGEYHQISGDAGKSYIVWSIKIILDDSIYSSILIYKRYSELQALRTNLLNHFPQDAKNIPDLPPKDSINLDRLFLSNNWLEHRRKGIQWFLSNILLNPKFQNSSIVKDFILK